ncbi:helix-turn-helix domain-containing protein [Amycolatopsis sp. NBC_00345]|uniref:helix-turn-helix domain-containing protein n=1 Tax=Amycolatopsis sp. NBC_00345 TaxID=2975955 RepID=UPI002E25E48E
MRELAGRMRAVDPGAGAALQVVAHFDALVEARAGLEVTVRTAAVLAGCPAGLAVPARRLLLRVEPDGRRADGEPGGVVTPVPGHEGAVTWLEREPPGDAEFDRVVLDRLAATAGIVLDRTGTGVSEVDPGAVEVVLDAGAGEAARVAAARRLGLAVDGEFVVTVAVGVAGQRPWTARLGDVEATIEPAGQVRPPRGQRSATGPVVGVRELPLSYQQARVGLRLTGEPGPSHVDTAALGGLLALADGCDSPSAVAEVALLERVTSAYSWALATLTSVAAEASLRSAAGVLHVHHSTLQSRVELVEHRLGYAVTTPAGRTRLTIALALRLLRRNR